MYIYDFRQEPLISPYLEFKVEYTYSYAVRNKQHIGTNRVFSISLSSGRLRKVPEAYRKPCLPLCWFAAVP